MVEIEDDLLFRLSRRLDELSDVTMMDLLNYAISQEMNAGRYRKLKKLKRKMQGIINKEAYTYNKRVDVPKVKSTKGYTV